MTSQSDDDPAVRLPIDGFLDLHAFTPGDVAGVVTDYLDAAQAAALDQVRIVHGRGRGVQRRIVHAVLERHPAVTDFWDAPDAHLGATVVRLRRASPRV